VRKETGLEPKKLDDRYTELFDELCRMCLVLGAGDRSEDIAQETLIYGRTHLAELRDPTKLRPWLRRIAARAARRRTKVWVTLGSEDHVAVLHDPAFGIDASNAMARLPRRERQAVVLVFGMGYTQEEVGELMGISRGTVAASIWRARQKLARALRDYRTEKS
jgi:RNA polymerase sigma-70 factor (ECF subfamily)